MVFENKILISDNNEIKELKGQELESFNLMREKMHNEYEKMQFEIEETQKLRDSAIAKLAKLGLTEDEAKAIVGIQ